MKEPKQHGIRHHFQPATCSPDNISNFVETFNNVVQELRDKPISSSLEAIRKHIQLWVMQRKTKVKNFEGLSVPSVKEPLKKIARNGSCWTLAPNGKMTFDYMHYNVNYTVNLQQKLYDWVLENH